MRTLFYIWILSLVVSSGFAQIGADNPGLYENNDEMNILLNDQESYFQLLQALRFTEAPALKDWEKLTTILDKKASKKRINGIRFLEIVFHKTQSVLFKDYQKHAAFNDLLRSGTYDCVTGTAAYGLLLERYGFDYKIIETDAHVFLLAEFEGDSVVFESTLPLHGFFKGQGAARDFINQFLNPNQAAQDDPSDWSVGGITVGANSIFQTISLKELAGLQYYNDAILRFNSNQFQEAYNQAVKAEMLHPSDRVSKLKELLEPVKNLQIARMEARTGH
jgi:hypothetical protein